MTKNDHTSINEYKKNRWNLIFLLIQPIPHLSCKFEHFKKKNLEEKKLLKKNVKHFWKQKKYENKLFFGGWLRFPPKIIQGLRIFLGLVDPSRNRLASSAYFAKPGFSVLHACVLCNAYIKIYEILFFSTVVKFTREMRNRLNRKNNQISDFFQFLFFELWLFLF